MIRVVHVLTRTNIGGPSVMLVDLLDGLSTKQFEQAVVRGASVPEEGDYLEGRTVNAEVVTIGGLRRSVGVISELRSLFVLVRTLRRIKPDVVHTHMAKAGVIGRLAATLAGVPVRIHTFHGHLLHGYFSPAVTRLVIVVERVLRRLTTHTLVVGAATRRDLIEARIVKSATSTTILPPVRSLPRINPSDARRRLGLPADGVIVGFVGRLTSIKRPDRFLALAVGIPEATFVIFGDGPLRETVLKDAADLPNVRVLTWNSDVALVFGALDIGVLTSDNEGIPLSLIEAATLGVPVVATDVGGVREIVDDGTTGYVVANDEELAATTRRLVGDPQLRRSLGERAAILVAERCSMDMYLDVHAKLYERLTST